jgi:hypothetical protein
LGGASPTIPLPLFYHVAASNFNSACSMQSYWIPWHPTKYILVTQRWKMQKKRVLCRYLNLLLMEGLNYSKGSKQSIKSPVDSIKTIVLFMFFRIYAINGSLKTLEINYVLTTSLTWMWETKIESHHIMVLSLLKQVVVCQFIDDLQKRIFYPSISIKFNSMESCSTLCVRMLLGISSTFLWFPA